MSLTRFIQPRVAVLALAAVPRINYVPLNRNLMRRFADAPGSPPVDETLLQWLYVANIPFVANENDLRAEFSNFGAVERVKLIRDKFTSRSKGFAFIGFSSGFDQAMNAKVEMKGRALKIAAAKENSVYPAGDSRNGEGGGGGGGQYGQRAAGGGGGGGQRQYGQRDTTKADE